LVILLGLFLNSFESQSVEFLRVEDASADHPKISLDPAEVASALLSLQHLLLLWLRVLSTDRAMKHLHLCAVFEERSQARLPELLSFLRYNRGEDS